jgi:Zn-dependent protease
MESLIQNIAIYAIPVLLAITLHEAAHGYIAKRCGDTTAFALGRVTLNPLKHIDPMGTILMPVLLYVATSGAFLFGYAKPVPINTRNLKNPRRDMALVALAGPASNYFQAIVWALLLTLIGGIGLREPFFVEMAKAGVLVNIIMAVFNLFPLPPLDGGRVLVSVLPYKQASFLERIEPYGFFIVMGLVVAGVVSKIWMQPLMDFSYTILNLLMSPLRALFA